MNCPNCQGPIEETQKFCQTCGANLLPNCSGCGNALLPGDRFCGACGLELGISKWPEKKEGRITKERKLITSLVVDITGYSTFSERLDPKALKDLVSNIFGEIAQIVIKYEGHIEKFTGDQMKAFFGVPRVHEDDPVRAVKTASEIHQVVHRLSLKTQETIGQSLWASIGINTGLAVTEFFDFDKAVAPGNAGDAVNIASGLCSLAKPGETLVGQATYVQTNGFFDFKPLKPFEIEGETKPVRAYRLLALRNLPHKRYCISEHRAVLIGRQWEMAVLARALARLQNGKAYSVVAICGEAGTGKSRLIEEFQATLDLTKITWMEGHAYASTRNISYSPLINLIKRDLAVEEEDTPGLVAAKLEGRLKGLDLQEDIAPFLGNLLSLHYPAVAKMSPEFWRSRLHRAIPLILQALARQGPVVICFEDLHWADPLFLNFLRDAVFAQVPGVILLYSFRPPLDLFSGDEISKMGAAYQEIRLHDLSAAEIQEMVASVLQTTAVPEDLERFIQEKVGTNPFYVEEMINSLIESEILQSDNGNWRLTQAIDASEIPSSIQAVISGRIDRLEGTVKYLLQQASVIGKTLPYEILRRLTRHPDALNRHLEQLEDLGLVRKSSPSEHEYDFKHALIQEVAYSGLLQEDRLAMHQQIGLVMEQVFADRLPEFYETLAFHFRHSPLYHKAFDYLRKSGKKSLNKYAVQESHEYYLRAFQILEETWGDSEAEKSRLIDFLNEWALVFYYRADFVGFTELFLKYQEMAESLADNALLAIFYAWLGLDLFCSGKPKESYRCSIKALELSQETRSDAAMGLIYSNLIWCCAELKLLDEGLHYGEEVLAKSNELDPMSYNMSIGGLAAIYLFLGDSQKNLELGRILLESGKNHSDLRSTVVGHICTSYAHYSAGDFPTATEWGQKAVEISNDPLFTVWPQMVLASYHVQSGKFQEAEEILLEIIPSCRQLGMIYVLTHAQALYGVVLMASGQFSRGLKVIKAELAELTQSGRLLTYYLVEFCLAEIYFLIATRARPLDLWSALKNPGFFMKEVPFARRKAIAYLNRVIRVGKEVGARSFAHSHALLDLEILLGRPKYIGKA
jgi:class 3 adenylate cyclase/tetratricopeptide (TPR) repeat protein